MATTETISSNYAGEAAQRFYSAVLKSPLSITGGGVTVQDGIRFKWNIPRVNLSGIIGDATCDFTPTGTVTREERVLEVEGFDVNMKLCKDNYRPTFDPMGSSYWSGLAPNFSSHLIGLTGANVAQSRENTIWKGQAANAGEFDGFEVLFTNEPLQPAGQEVLGTTVDASNVIAELEKVVNAMPSALYAADGIAIRIPTSIYKFYVQAQSALGAYDAFHERRAQFTFQGIPLIHCPGMSDDVMFATYANNLYYGVGSAGDAQRVDLIDQQPLDGSSNVNIVMKWADGIQVANPEDVVTYGIVNTGN